MIFLVLSEKIIFLFPENMILFLETKGKMIFLKKCLEIWRYFLQVFWKDGLSRKFTPDQDLFCNIWKDGIYFFRKIWYFFFGREMKGGEFFQKMRGNMVFSLYMRGRYKHNTGPPAKKQRRPCLEKIHLRVRSLASPKKMVFIVENMAFLLNYHVDWYPRKDPRSSHRRCSTNTGVLRNFSEPLFNKAAGLRPATLLKKKLWRRCFPMSFARFLRTSFYRTPLGDCFWSSNYSLFFYGDLYRRFYILLSSERKAGNLICRILIWLLLQVIWLEISSQELY